MFAIGMAAMGGYALAPLTIVGLLVGTFFLAGLGGILAKLLADAVAKTGVLNSFAIAEGQIEEI
jgi:ABC-type thiamin/hydroxymethylpyrimidine transport system permease subunit